MNYRRIAGLGVVAAATIGWHSPAFTEAEKAAYLAARGIHGMYGANGRNIFANPLTLNPVVAHPGTLQAIEVSGFPQTCVDVLDFFLPLAVAPLPPGVASPVRPLEATAPDFTDNSTGWRIGHTWGTHNPEGFRSSGYLYKVKWGEGVISDQFEYYAWDKKWVYLHQDNTSTAAGNNIQYSGYLHGHSVWYQGATVYPRYLCVGMVANTPRVIHLHSGQSHILNAATFVVNRFWRVWGAGINGGRPAETLEVAVLQDPDRRDDAVRFNNHLTYAYADVAYYVRGYGFVAFENSVANDPKNHPVVAWTWPTALRSRPMKQANRNPYLYDMIRGLLLP